MIPDPHDTIVAIGTPLGGAARGIIRLSGPRVLASLAWCFVPDDPQVVLKNLSTAQAVSGSLTLGTSGAKLPCDLFLWPDKHSYTRQRAAELHLLGSPPLLDHVLGNLCRQGVRLAQPGEFTLRAFLAGRLDLTQAEAVLGIIDSTNPNALDSALQQLAGGLSQPLSQLRNQLLGLLSHLEAGLDFVEEEIEFVSREELADKLSSAAHLIDSTLEQMTDRAQSQSLPRVVLVGAPNAGKSSLFNAMLERFPSPAPAMPALVSPSAGTTRDYLSACLDLGRCRCELIDTAGLEVPSDCRSITGTAQDVTHRQMDQADLLVMCIEATAASYSDNSSEIQWFEGPVFSVLTKGDLAEGDGARDLGQLACSSLTGEGLEALAQRIADQITTCEPRNGQVLANTALRCRESLERARSSLSSALAIVAENGGEELVAAEIRATLCDLGAVVGAVYTDDILDRIFSQFCIGK